LLGLDPIGRAARHREFVDVHAPPTALVHHVEPPRVLAPWTRATSAFPADLSNSHTHLLVRLRHSGWCASTNPVQYIGGVKPPSSHAEPLRIQQSAQVRRSNGFFVAADEFGHLERRHQAIGQSAVDRRVDRELRVGRSTRHVECVRERVERVRLMTSKVSAQGEKSHRRLAVIKIHAHFLSILLTRAAPLSMVTLLAITFAVVFPSLTALARRRP